MTYAEVVVNRIEYFRKKKNLTISQLASLSGVPHSTVDNIIRGISKSPEGRTIQRIILGLDLKAAEFWDFPEINEVPLEDV